MVPMEYSNKTAQQIFNDYRANPSRPRFGFGVKPAVLNIDLQCAYTSVSEFETAYETDPKQLDHVNRISALARARGLPVFWTYGAYMDSALDCGVWGTRTDTPDSIQNIKFGSRRAELDGRLEVDRSVDAVINKRMPSAFHETHLQSMLTFKRIDTLILTGGSTSGCVRATAVDGLSRSYRIIVPLECVADVHESRHFASLFDIALKYGDVIPVAEVVAYLEAYEARNV
jgi:nicotinamidase-related amidase